MRTFVPADTLVYLETNDLATTVSPIIESIPFAKVAKSKPDISALEDVQLAVAVTGFEITEEKLTDDNSVGRVQPRFVAIADTHAWNYQAVAFADQALGQFVTDIYGADVTQDRVDKNDGQYFTWTSNEGRKSYAQVIGSVIWFGNDESAIERSLAVRRGELDSFAKNAKIGTRVPGTLARGYISEQGVAQIANILGLQFASQASDNPQVRAAIAGILPQIVRGSITEVFWDASLTEMGIEDKWRIVLPDDVAGVLNETMSPIDAPDFLITDYFPTDTPVVTVYNLKNPQIAWRSILAASQKNLDPLAGRILAEFSGELFAPYGIRDPETFLSSVGPVLVTGKCDEDGEQSAVIGQTIDAAKTEKTLAAQLRPRVNDRGMRSFESADKEFAARFDFPVVISGDSSCVNRLASPSYPGTQLPERKWSPDGSGQKSASITTIGRDGQTASQLAEVLSQKKSEQAMADLSYTTETRFTKTGIERRTISAFGMIGSIIARLSDDR